jgi:hypothetical protein
MKHNETDKFLSVMEYDLENTSLVLQYLYCGLVDVLLATPKPQLAKVTIPAVVGNFLNKKANLHRTNTKRQLS